MAKCECGKEFSDKRASLGYDKCLDCGQQQAQQEKMAKSERVATLFNKGPYMYICSVNELPSLGRK